MLGYSSFRKERTRSRHCSTVESSIMPPLVALEDAASKQQRQLQQQPRIVVNTTVAPIVRDYQSSPHQTVRFHDGDDAAASRGRVTGKANVGDLAQPVGPTATSKMPPAMSRPPSPCEPSATIPRPPPWSSLRRQRSEPVNTQRRAIFERYWKQGDRSGNNGAFSPRLPLIPAPGSPLLSRARSASLSEDRPGCTTVDLCYRDFGPPQGCSLEKREHYCSTRNLPSHAETSLPPLPVPLQRFYSDGRVSSLRGMYPIMGSPKPILRQSSYRSLLMRREDQASDLSVPSLQPTVLLGVADSLNLTRSVSAMMKPSSVLGRGGGGPLMMGRLCPGGDCAAADGEDTSETASNTSTTSTERNSSPVGVSFDPRITVTEFDDPIPRAWFTDADLERFRVETVLVAQRYLLQNPDMIEVYNKPRLDPVTGTLRKRALYSLPALSSVDAVDQDEPEADLAAAANQCRQSMSDLAWREVRTILVVDRNKLILDLFRRSLQQLFPHARITTHPSGDEALRIFRASLQSTSGCFDLVIADERLHHPLASSGTPLLTAGKTSGSSAASQLHRIGGDLNGAGGRHVRHSSLQNLAGPSSPLPRGCSGSELLRIVSRLVVDEKAGAEESAAEASPWCEPGKCRTVPLLIGVSVDPEHDGPRLRECGADVVWGKPPPSMDERLRDELVARLVRKRERKRVATQHTAAPS